MHHDTQQLPSEMSPDVEMIEAFVEGVPVITRSSSLSSTSTTNMPDTTKNNATTTTTDDVILIKPGTSKVIDSTLLKFKIHFLDKTIKMNISDQSTVGKFYFFMLIQSAHRYFILIFVG